MLDTLYLPLVETNEPSTEYPKVSVILPSYNERDNIAELISRVDSVSCECSSLNGNCEVIIVDDNSPDGTGEFCHSLKETYPFLHVIIRETERGLASAIKCGLKESQGDIIVVMDADLSHTPEMVPVLINQLEEYSADMTVASRYINGGSMVSSRRCVLGSKLLNMYIRTLLRIPIMDVTGGFFAIRRRALEKLDLDSIFQGHGDYCFALLYKGITEGWIIRETSFSYYPRKNGASKTSFLKAGLSYWVRAQKLRLGAL